jgi:ATP-dependent RNA helicase RhlE
MSSFQDLGLATPLLAALTTAGYVEPTPIQAQAIPHVLAGHDVQGIAQTGTGKTAAFALPILHRLLAERRHPGKKGTRCLVMAPTRELASQIAESFRSYAAGSPIRVALMFGGVPKPRQARAVDNGVDVLVCTPGRLLDHLNDRAVNLGNVEVLVLDEADHMLDLGFIIPIKKIVSYIPKQRQTLFFSATMPKEIESLASALLHNPVHVAVTPVAKTADRVEQAVVFVEAARKRALLSAILKRKDLGRTLVFTRTKHGADKVVQHLEASGQRAAAIHGNKSQGQRERALAAFKDGSVPVLIATDIAARGIDVDGVTHVINFDLPNIPESYVHRIGRTARAGNAGMAISFCDATERSHLRGIEKLIRARLPVAEPEALAA